MSLHKVANPPHPTHTHNSYWLHLTQIGWHTHHFLQLSSCTSKTGLAPAHYTMNSYYSEIDEIPDEDQLQGVLTINDSNPRLTQQTPVRTPSSINKDDGNVLVGASYPPVPNKLVKRIRDGEFIEMADLLPERLGAGGDNDPVKSSKKWRTVTNILEWVRCFGPCISIIACSAPESMPDLLSYQALIIDAYTEYQSKYWSGYNRQFRQRAAVTPATSWSTMDTTLWNLAFGGQASLPRCTHCLSISHKSGECELSSDTHTTSTPYPTGEVVPERPSLQSQCPIWYAWNEDPAPVFPRHGCRYFFTYALRMSGYKTKGTKRSIALIMFNTNQQGHKGQLPTTNQPPKYSRHQKSLRTVVVVQL